MKKILIFSLMLVAAGILLYIFVLKNNSIGDSNELLPVDTDQLFDDYPSDDTDSGELPQ